MNLFLPEFRNALILLMKHDVRFMLIGGYAVIFYGYERATNDLDIWLEPSNDNKEKLIKALKEYGTGKESLGRLSKCDFTKPQFFFSGKIPRRIDFLTQISNVSFEAASKESAHFDMEGHRIPVIHYHHLVLSKIANRRLKDRADVEELQRIHKKKGSKKRLF